MSALQILERIYEWLSVVGLACLLSSCTLALKNNVDAFAHEEKTSLIPRTAGTSLAGQVVGNGIIVDVSKSFTQILELNKDREPSLTDPPQG